MHMHQLPRYNSCTSLTSFALVAYSCHGRWTENDTNFLITTPQSRTSIGAKRYCFIYREVGGVIHFSSSSQSCVRNITTGVEGVLAFNATNIGKYEMKQIVKLFHYISSIYWYHPSYVQFPGKCLEANGSKIAMSDIILISLLVFSTWLTGGAVQHFRWCARTQHLTLFTSLVVVNIFRWVSIPITLR